MHVCVRFANLPPSKHKRRTCSVMSCSTFSSSWLYFYDIYIYYSKWNSIELSCLLMFFLYLQNLQGITSSGKASVDSCHDEVCNKRSNDNSEGPPWQVPIELIIDWTLLTGEKSLANVKSNISKRGFHVFCLFPSVGPGFWRENQTLKHFTDSHNVSWTPPYCNILQYQSTANGEVLLRIGITGLVGTDACKEVNQSPHQIRDKKKPHPTMIQNIQNGECQFHCFSLEIQELDRHEATYWYCYCSN